MKAKPFIVIFSLVASAVGAATINQQIEAAEPMESCTVALADAYTASLPVARTTAQKAKGLSGRTDVAPGMVFAWETPQRPAVWMKDTHLPLDVAFVDASGDITQTMTLPALSLTPHQSRREIVAMIELPAGTLDRLGVSVGDHTTAHQCAIE